MITIPDRIARNAKAVVAGVGSVATAVSAALADSVIDAGEVGTIASALAVAGAAVYAVWRVPNRDDDR